MEIYKCNSEETLYDIGLKVLKYIIKMSYFHNKWNKSFNDCI